MDADAKFAMVRRAIEIGHPAHGYLIAGPVRGAAMTFAERILQTLFCREAVRPCGACEGCRRVMARLEPDIHWIFPEKKSRVISVEQMRQALIREVTQTALSGGWKAGVLVGADRMNEASANTFLKTLEEPPKHAIFILATSEKHKILPTILSRCQIFDFNRISVQDAVDHLKYVAQSEGVAVDEEGLTVIAQKADGAMRDALSIFDQIVAFSGKEITYKQVIENLNVLDYDYYFKLVDAFLADNYVDSLVIFDDILKNGFDAYHFVSGLSSHLRDLLVCKNPQSIQLLEVGNAIGSKYHQQSQACSVDFLYDALNVATDAELQYRNAKNKRLFVEFMLIKLARLISEKKKLLS